MHIEKNTLVKLRTFMGTFNPSNSISDNENYWKLIGECGNVIDDKENNDGRVLVLFEKNLDKFSLENHNPIKNSLWIRKSDLEIVSR